MVRTLYLLFNLRLLTNCSEERSPNQVYWPFEFGSLGDFTQYVIKACSPGPVTDTELIIVHYGLELLFTECSSVTGEDAVKQEYEAQALICSDSLETILSNLPFHITTNIVSVCAMYMAVCSSLKSLLYLFMATLIPNANQTDYLLPQTWQTLRGVDVYF